MPLADYAKPYFEQISDELQPLESENETKTLLEELTLEIFQDDAMVLPQDSIDLLDEVNHPLMPTFITPKRKPGMWVDVPLTPPPSKRVKFEEIIKMTPRVESPGSDLESVTGILNEGAVMLQREARFNAFVAG